MHSIRVENCQKSKPQTARTLSSISSVSLLTDLPRSNVYYLMTSTQCVNEIIDTRVVNTAGFELSAVK